MDQQAHDGTVGPLVDRLFRREAGRMTAWLIGWLGPSEADLASDVVQDALLRALKTWPWRGIPENPEAWLWRVARNIAIDKIRGRRPTTPLHIFDEPAEPPPQENLEDAELSLLFLCADPGLPMDSAVPLTLKLACGFSDTEIAGALSVGRGTVQQRLVRAKRQWRTAPPEVDLSSDALDARVNGVLNVIYLMLNEGYGGHHPLHWQRAVLCREATRLSLLLSNHASMDRSDTDALSALCLFHLARIDARMNGDGDIILLAEQDRSLWNKGLIREGFQMMDRAGRGSRITAYHLLAGIASCHVSATDYGSTNWKIVLGYYDQLVALDPESPYHRLNRAVALVESGEATHALDEVNALSHDRKIAGTYLLPATRAWILSRLQRLPEARRDLVKAAAMAPSDQVRRLLLNRLNSV